MYPPALATTPSNPYSKKRTAFHNFSRCKEIPDFPLPALFLLLQWQKPEVRCVRLRQSTVYIQKNNFFAHIFSPEILLFCEINSTSLKLYFQN